MAKLLPIQFPEGFTIKFTRAIFTVVKFLVVSVPEGCNAFSSRRCPSMARFFLMYFRIDVIILKPENYFSLVKFLVVLFRRVVVLSLAEIFPSMARFFLKIFRRVAIVLKPEN